MSFGLPSVKTKPDHAGDLKIYEGPYGVPDPMVAGLRTTKSKLGMAHPLEVSEKNYHLNQQKRDMIMLRNVQGLHAPLKLSMELNAAGKVGRLPFLQSSNLMHDVLTGRHIDLDFEDFLNPADMQEVVGQPHAIIERSLGLL